MKIAITGEGGFLGYHLTQYYKWVKEYEVISLGRDYVNNITLLKDCDLLIHCAGVNRGDDVYNGNVSLARDLINSLDEEAKRIGVTRQSIIKFWIAERLKEELRDEGRT